MKSLFLALLLLTLISCENAAEKVENNPEITTNLTQDTEVVAENPAFLSLEKWDALKNQETDEYYIVNYAGAETEKEAIDMVDSLAQRFPEAGYLWIPDFASLSGKALYAIFLYQGKYDFSALEFLQKNKNDIDGLYAVRVDQSKERWVAYSPINIRVNGEKSKMILTYATPEDEEAYANEGGEDWGWFVYDVTTYFNEHHPEVLFESVYYSGLLPEEIESLEKELELDGFCYIFLDGKNKYVAGHDLPESVITSACEFFGFAEPDFGY